MLFVPVPLGNRNLSSEVLTEDKKNCRKFGPCGVGKEALYMGSTYARRHFYVTWREVKRVFKRVAMSKGGFSGKGSFGALAYLVVQFDNGKEKQSRFRREEDVDRLLALVREEHPNIPTHSAKAERMLSNAAAAEESRFLKELTPEAQTAVHNLTQARVFLEQHPALSNLLVSAAKQKRIVDNIKPSYLAAGVAVAALSILSALYGVDALLDHRDHAARLCGSLELLVGLRAHDDHVGIAVLCDVHRLAALAAELRYPGSVLEFLHGYDLHWLTSNHMIMGQ